MIDSTCAERGERPRAKAERRGGTLVVCRGGINHGGGVPVQRLDRLVALSAGIRSWTCGTRV